MHKLAGPFRQIVILFWKNGILFRRNKMGAFSEILLSFLFILVIIIMRNLIKVKQTKDTDYELSNPLSFMNSSENQTMLLYYPNNDFIKDIVTNGYEIMKSQNPSLSTDGYTSNKNASF
jgi:hypothetical protein